MKIAAIIPVKTFINAKTRLDIPVEKRKKLCEIMLDEILRTLSISPMINQIIVVSKDQTALELGKKYKAVQIIDDSEKGVNEAVALADKYAIENNFDATIVLPQDIPFIKTQDIDFMLKFQSPPNFAIVVPSRRFDGTNALVRMPSNLMETHYDEDSYRIHMDTAKKHTGNVALVFVKRIMWDVDNLDDLEFLIQQNEKPEMIQKIKNILN